MLWLGHEGGIEVIWGVTAEVYQSHLRQQESLLGWVVCSEVGRGGAHRWWVDDIDHCMAANFSSTALGLIRRQCERCLRVTEGNYAMKRRDVCSICVFL